METHIYFIITESCSALYQTNRLIVQTLSQSIEAVLLESKPDITPSTIETKEVNFSSSFSVIIDVCRTDVDRYMYDDDNRFITLLSSVSK